MPDRNHPDIKERTFDFAVRVVQLVNSLPRTAASIELGKQLIRSGTSIGANVEEADGADTKKDFVYKITISRKEARETRYWLRLLIASGILVNAEIKLLLSESDELVKILSKIIQTARRNMQKALT